MTPNLAEAICLTLEFALSPFGRTLNLLASSPPSPLHEAPLILFMPVANVSCASADNAPWDILPLPNLLRIFSNGSTSSTFNFFSGFLNSSRSLKLIGGKLCMPAEYFLYCS